MRGKVDWIGWAVWFNCIGRVFTNGLVDRGSIPKIQKMVYDTSLLNTQHYKVRIKSKEAQSREKSSALPNTSVQQLLKRSLRVANFTFLL